LFSTSKEPDWTELVDTVGALPAVQDFIQYLTDAGLPVDDHPGLGSTMSSKVPFPEPIPMRRGSLRSFLDEVEAILSFCDFLYLLSDKILNSPDFQNFYVEISSEEAHTLVEEVRALDEVQRLPQRLIDMGVKVEDALDIVYELFGWGEPEKF
jgi:hypothetical protein